MFKFRFTNITGCIKNTVLDFHNHNIQVVCFGKSKIQVASKPESDVKTTLPIANIFPFFKADKSPASYF